MLRLFLAHISAMVTTPASFQGMHRPITGNNLRLRGERWGWVILLQHVQKEMQQRVEDSFFIAARKPSYWHLICYPTGTSDLGPLLLPICKSFVEILCWYGRFQITMGKAVQPDIACRIWDCYRKIKGLYETVRRNLQYRTICGPYEYDHAPSGHQECCRPICKQTIYNRISHVAQLTQTTCSMALNNAPKTNFILNVLNSKPLHFFQQEYTQKNNFCVRCVSIYEITVNWVLE